jgi:hypothetical protein
MPCKMHLFCYTSRGTLIPTKRGMFFHSGVLCTGASPAQNQVCVPWICAAHQCAVQHPQAAWPVVFRVRSPLPPQIASASATVLLAACSNCDERSTSSWLRLFMRSRFSDKREMPDDLVELIRRSLLCGAPCNQQSISRLWARTMVLSLPRRRTGSAKSRSQR